MKRFFKNWWKVILWVIAGGIIGVLLVYLHRADSAKFYGSIRGPLIGGFISVSSFLFALMTNIIFRMKSEIYDSPEYAKTLEKAVRLNGVKPKRYAPLERFSSLLSGSIVCCFATSVVQIFIGSFDGLIFVYMCLFTVGASIGMMCATALAFMSNLGSFFTFWREKKDKETGETLI